MPTSARGSGTRPARHSATPTVSTWPPIRSGAAAAARAHVEASADAIVVHFDVDAVDSAGLPLANYPHHGEGLTLGTAVTVPPELRASPAVICLVLTDGLRSAQHAAAWPEHLCTALQHEQCPHMPLVARVFLGVSRRVGKDRPGGGGQSWLKN